MAVWKAELLVSGAIVSGSKKAPCRVPPLCTKLLQMLARLNPLKQSTQ